MWTYYKGSISGFQPEGAGSNPVVHIITFSDINAYDGYDCRKKIVKKLYGATYGNVVSVLSVHHQASVTVAEVEDARC